jgi:hypothetical protein
MIKLFRNIRKNLINEGKTTKYFKYAIGEIFLVVIGILIALSINNWSEKNKKEELGKDYLRQLQQDLKLDAKLYEGQIGNLSSQLKIADSLIIILEKVDTDIDTVKDIIKNGTNHWGIYDNYDLNNNTFLALQNSGNMNLIETSVYNKVLDLNRLQKEYVRIIRDNSLTLLAITMESDNDLPQGGGKRLKEQLWETVNWNSASIKFVNKLYAIKGLNNFHIKVTENILNQTNSLKDIITSEIENN